MVLKHVIAVSAALLCRLNLCSGREQPAVTYYPSSPNTPSVTVYGSKQSADIDLFFGIPFAKPPLGDLRFQAPQPPDALPSSINQTGYRPGCMSSGSDVSEDCLYLSVWRPNKCTGTDALPVFVWLYGGSFIEGSAGAFNFTDFLETAIERSQPMIIVTPNYRLGPFGFGCGQEYLSHNASNSGLKDVVAALNWVQENIKSFGGDPNRVTLGGQSAGGVAASLMTLIKDPPKLNGIVLNSGYPSANPLAPTTEGFPELYPALLDATNCTNSNDTFQCLRAIDAVILQNATNQLREEPRFALGFPWNPNVDYDLIPDRPSYLLSQGKFARIPILAGDDLDEGTIFVQTDTNSTQGVVNQIEWLEPVNPSQASVDTLLELYSNVPALGCPYGTGNQTFGLNPQYKRIASMYGDLAFQHARRWMLEQMNANDWCQTWTWLWDASPHPGTRTGISHTFDAQYFLGQVDERDSGPAGVAISSLALEYWLNFIHYADPNGQCPGEITYWPKYQEGGASANMLLFSGGNTTFNASVIQDDYRKEQIAYINAHLIDFNS
ncbi:Alpha/Beta hydrolase protein [Kockovaella imperatae]|uniref:Carboxylic ester hydrolase n=1 Tax=Kockovaella imperatae TaxID=4999 RepID=A0A1Y1US12_9TREE|nr:Alpha/Beta hydrolase protein [Kockovaella imperatae]ORX40256.1 Alpha/Beta hydrolase protein [Kockovaella imperatae]